MNAVSLCAGVGAMDLGLQVAIGDAYRTVGYVEREAYAAAVLVARMGDEALDRAPIWDDLTTFDGKPYRGRVDLISSGLPCQPYSVAGKQAGHADERALWPHFVRIVEECEPALVFIENVPGFAKLFEPVWRRLRDLGFEWAPPLLQTASESGAPHIRRRFFALGAHSERVGRIFWKVSEGRMLDDRKKGGRSEGSGRITNACTDAPDPDRSRLERRSLSGCGRADERPAGSVGAPGADSDGRGCEGEWCGWVFDGERQTLRHDPHGLGCGCRIRGTLWSSESPPVRVAARTSSWVDDLRAVGNVGAPPVVYARAFRRLLDALRQ